MAASGSFRGADGHLYYVEFSGAGVPGDELLIVGVTLGMAAGDRKFVGYKTTTCQISVQTDSPLVWAYARGAKAISVEVMDETDSECVFTGYVVPFTFEQTWTGTADVVTIECVDCITAAKDELYRSSEDDDRYGLNVPAYAVLADVISHAGGRDKVREVVHHRNFYQADGTGEGKTLDLMVAQAGFLQDEMTALDALNAVLVYCGYTAAMVGNRLMLWDEHCLTHAGDAQARNAVVERWVYDGGWQTTETIVQDALRKVEVGGAGMPMHNDLTVSIERAYDGVQLTPTGSAVSVLLPDVCAADNIKANTDGRGTTPILVGGDDYREWRIPVESKVMEMDSYITPDAVSAPTWRNGAMMVAMRRYEQYPDRGIWLGGDAETVLWLRCFDAQQVVYARPMYGYAHTGGMVEMKMSFRVAYATDRLGEAADLTQSLPMVVPHIRVGNRYVKDAYVTPVTYSADPDGIVHYTHDFKPFATAVAQNNWSDGYLHYVGDENARVSLELSFSPDTSNPTANNRPVMGEIYTYNPNVVITQLELVAVGDEVWTGHEDMHHEYVADARDMLDVSVGLTTRDSGQTFNPDNHGHVYGYNARPGVVTDMYYPVGGYIGGEKTLCPMGGIVMRQLKARYGEPHVRYSVTVDGRVLPTDTIAFGGGKYTVEGYERDLVNNTTKIIID